MSNYFSTKGGHQFTQYVLFSAGIGPSGKPMLPPNPLDVVDKNMMISADLQDAYNDEIIMRMGYINSAQFYNMECLPAQSIKYVNSNIYETAVNLRNPPVPTRRLN